MATTTTAFAAALGRRVRRARYQARKSQPAVADEVGISQSTVSRMELGRGGTVPLATWERVCEAVGLDLSAVAHTPFRLEAYAIHLRCHRLVADLAAEGGWSAWTIGNVDDPDRTETISSDPNERKWQSFASGTWSATYKRRSRISRDAWTMNANVEARTNASAGRSSRRRGERPAVASPNRRRSSDAA
jgi:transcriptional regulator with XRE-family HTH domain